MAGMHGWIFRPTSELKAIKFYEGPYMSHESLAYYHGPAERYPGCDRNRIAVIIWHPPHEGGREIAVFDGYGKRISSLRSTSDRVHVAFGAHGAYLIGDISYEGRLPGTMTIFFPDTGALRPIGYHDNAYWDQTAEEHPHPGTSPDGTKLLFKGSHMSRMDIVETDVLVIGGGVSGWIGAVAGCAFAWCRKARDLLGGHSDADRMGIGKEAMVSLMVRAAETEGNAPQETLWKEKPYGQT